MLEALSASQKGHLSVRILAILGRQVVVGRTVLESHRATYHERISRIEPVGGPELGSSAVFDHDSRGFDGRGVHWISVRSVANMPWRHGAKPCLR